MTTKVEGSSEYRSVAWSHDALVLIDQRNLPETFETLRCSTVEETRVAIADMAVRGAPAIGAAGGFGMAICARNHAQASSTQQLLAKLTEAKSVLDGARPTAVNLMWATARLVDLAKAMQNAGISAAKIATALLDEAKQLAEDDVAINKRMGDHGASVVPSFPDRAVNILHHCNTGSLATVYWGTAIGVIYSAHQQNKNVHVWVDETRPRLQGARLSAWELMRQGIDLHLIVDNAAGHLMYTGQVDIILFGADRVAANGDVANKIGTYKISVCGKENGVPVYAVVPTSTIDLDVLDGRGIVIEERSASEVTDLQFMGKAAAPEGVKVFNPAFDVTPHRYLTGIITEEGICYPPFAQSLRRAKEAAEARIKQSWEATLKAHLAG